MATTSISTLLQNLVADMVAVGGTRLRTINQLADELCSAQHSQQQHIRTRQKEANQLSVQPRQ